MDTGQGQAFELELLGRLGLDDRATPEDVVDAHDELQAFLATAPRSLRGWARSQASAADAAFALLSDPTAWPGAGALPAPQATRSDPQPDVPATPPVRRAARPARAAAATTAEPEDGSDDEFEAMLAAVTPSMHRERFAGPRDGRAGARVAPGGPVARAVSDAGPRRRLPRVLAILAGIVGVVGVVTVVYALGGGQGLPGIAASPSPVASGALDEARVAELMGRVQADPKDAAALLELGDAFFQAGEYSVAATWLEKLIAIEPDNVRARLALGATRFNLGELDAAEAHWLEALRVDPDNVEAHYDLGFLYLNEEPADLDGVRREWREVIRLSPDSDIATIVQQHLDALASNPPASGAPAAAPTAAPPAASPTVAP